MKYLQLYFKITLKYLNKEYLAATCNYLAKSPGFKCAILNFSINCMQIEKDTVKPLQDYKNEVKCQKGYEESLKS